MADGMCVFGHLVAVAADSGCDVVIGAVRNDERYYHHVLRHLGISVQHAVDGEVAIDGTKQAEPVPLAMGQPIGTYASTAAPPGDPMAALLAKAKAQIVPPSLPGSFSGSARAGGAGGSGARTARGMPSEPQLSAAANGSS